MKKIYPLILTGLLACSTVTRAATFTVTTAAADGAGSFSQALRDVNATPATQANTIEFAIPGAGPHHILPPVNGFPLVYHDNTTIDGTTQPGWVKNTAAITNCNNAVIKIALDGSNGNFRDMAYVFYGQTFAPPVDPAINNSALYGDGGNAGGTGREQAGYDPNTFNIANPPTYDYTTGEKAVLGIYRSTNVTVKGIAVLSAAGDGYGIALAHDFEYDTTIHDRLTYNNGTCRGFHLAGCVFGIDPGTSADALSQNAVTFFRHRDRNGLSAAARRPFSPSGSPSDADTLPNGENFVIGVAAGSADPRAEFNVFKCTELAIAAEAIHSRMSGNQFFNPPEFGRSSDASDNPSILYGTDGDGVNDADEGNLFVNPVLLISQYNVRNKLFVYAGNTFGVACAGTRPGNVVNVVDGFAFNQGNRVRFGTDGNGISDALEGNTVYDSLLFSWSGPAANNSTWINMRGNSLVNNTVQPPLGDATTAGAGLNVYDKFINAPIVPVITAAAAGAPGSVTATCGTPVGAPYQQLIADLYVSDLESDPGTPQGKTYLASYALTAAEAASGGPFTIAAPLTTGQKVTLSVTYVKGVAVEVTSGPGCGVTLTYPLGNYSIQSTPSLTPTITWSTVGPATGTSTFVAGCSGTLFYRLVSTASSAGGGQTSPSSASFAVP